MVMVLKDVSPLGRSLEEYMLMFDLSERELEKKILGVGDGPASFNAEIKEIRGSVVSVDPLYQCKGQDIEKRFYEVIDEIIDQMRSTRGDWTWGYHNSPEHLKIHREKAIKKFVRDFESGKREGRYITGGLPKLDFKDSAFDIAVCSHFLFLYSEHFDYEFHKKSVYEMLRVADEVRIFPLLDLRLNRSSHLAPLLRDLRTDGFRVKIERVNYEMQRGGNEMMRIKKS